MTNTKIEEIIKKLKVGKPLTYEEIEALSKFHPQEEAPVEETEKEEQTEESEEPQEEEESKEDLSAELAENEQALLAKSGKGFWTSWPWYKIVITIVALFVVVHFVWPGALGWIAVPTQSPGNMNMCETKIASTCDGALNYPACVGYVFDGNQKICGSDESMRSYYEGTPIRVETSKSSLSFPVNAVTEYPQTTLPQYPMTSTPVRMY